MKQCLQASISFSPTLLNNRWSSVNKFQERKQRKEMHLKYESLNTYERRNYSTQTPTKSSFGETDGIFSKAPISTTNIYQISHKYPQFIVYENPEIEVFPRSFTKNMKILRPSTSELEFRFNVPPINESIHPEVQESLRKNLGMNDLEPHQKEIYERIVLPTQNAIRNTYSTERRNFASGLQKWAFQLWRLNKKVQLGTMYFLKKHQEHVRKAIENGENSVPSDLFFYGPRDSGKTLSYILAAIETAKCYKAWEQDYVQPGYRVLILVPSTYQAKKIGKLFDAALYPPFEESNNSELERANKVLESYKKLKFLQKDLDSKRKNGIIEQQEDFAFLKYEGLINLNEEDPNKVSPYRHINHLVLTSDKDFENQIDAMDFSVPEIVIATPDQLVKHLSNSDYFNNLKLLVIDDVKEFSQFEKEIIEIKKHLKPNHRTVYISDTKVEDIPNYLKFMKENESEESNEEETQETKWIDNGRNIEYFSVPDLKSNQKLKQHHNVITCIENGSLLNELIDLIQKNRGKKILITHQNNELLKLVSELLAVYNVNVCTTTELDDLSEIDTATRYFNNRENGVLLAHDLIALNYVASNNVDIVINFGDASGTQSSYLKLLDLFKENAERSYFLSLGDQFETLSNLHKSISFSRTNSSKSILIDEEKVNQVLSKISNSTSASIVNYFRTLIENPNTLQFYKNAPVPKFLGTASGADAESAQEAVSKTVELYKLLGFTENNFPKSSVFQAQAVASENAMRATKLSKWTYHNKSLNLLKAIEL